MPSAWPKRIVSSAPQLAPRGFSASHSVTGAPPLTDTRLSWFSAQKPNHWPSAEKNGLRPDAPPPSVPRIGIASI